MKTQNIVCVQTDSSEKKKKKTVVRKNDFQTTESLKRQIISAVECDNTCMQISLAFFTYLKSDSILQIYRL